MELIRFLQSDSSKITYHTREERGWVHPGTPLSVGRRLLEAVGVMREPTLPPSEMISFSQLRNRRDEMLAAALPEDDANQLYSSEERDDMLSLVHQINAHLQEAQHPTVPGLNNR